MKSAKPCPICGALPLIEKQSLDRGNGHGYPGYYEVTARCPNCELPHEASVDDVYYKGNLYDKVIEEWNKEVNRIEKFMKEKD